MISCASASQGEACAEQSKSYSKAMNMQTAMTETGERIAGVELLAVDGFTIVRLTELRTFPIHVGG